MDKSHIRRRVRIIKYEFGRDTFSPLHHTSGDGTFGERLGHEDGALTNGMRVLTKEAPQGSLTLSATGEHSERTALCEPGSGVSPDVHSAGALNLDFSFSRTVRQKCLLFQRPSVR